MVGLRVPRGTQGAEGIAMRLGVCLLLLAGCGGDPFTAAGPDLLEREDGAPDVATAEGGPQQDGGGGGSEADGREEAREAATDPDHHVCGTSPSDGTKTPVPPQFWASVVHGPLATPSYCDPMAASPPPTAYTCAGILAVWSCQAWLGAGSTLGCHANGSVLQVDCSLP